jgi:hypothetical protein
MSVSSVSDVVTVNHGDCFVIHKSKGEVKVNPRRGHEGS